MFESSILFICFQIIWYKNGNRLSEVIRETKAFNYIYSEKAFLIFDEFPYCLLYPIFPPS